jgi:hypothetical protein
MILKILFRRIAEVSAFADEPKRFVCRERIDFVGRYHVRSGS